MNSRTYIYAVHYVGKVEGKKRVRVCYLGPEGGYGYVSRLHVREGLILKGLIDSRRALEYLDAIIGYVTSVEIDPKLRIEIVERLKKISKILDVDLCGDH